MNVNFLKIFFFLLFIPVKYMIQIIFETVLVVQVKRRSFRDDLKSIKQPALL